MAHPAKRKQVKEPVLLPEEMMPGEEKPETSPAIAPSSDAARRRRASLGVFVQLMLCVGALAVLAFPTFVILTAGMVPTLVAILVDERPNRHRIQTIGAFNLAGVVVFLVPLWAAGHTAQHAVRLLSDVYTWAVMYTAAAIGVGALWLGPQVAAAVSNVMAVRQRHRLEAIRAQLLDEWGTDLVPEGELPPEHRKADSSEETGDA